MRTTTVTALAPLLLPLSTFINGSTRIGRSGKRVRIYRPETEFVTTPAATEAIKTLLSEGVKVRVYQSEKVLYPTLADDGAVVWNDSRETSRERDYTCVEVEL